MNPVNRVRSQPVDNAVGDLALRGVVLAVASDQRHRFSKATQDSIQLIEGHGVANDVHAGPLVRHRYLVRRNPRLANLRQVHLIPSELFELAKSAGYDIGPGALGENITTKGLDLERLPLHTQLRLGSSAMIELTGLRTPCILIDRFQNGLQRLLLNSDRSGPKFRSGVMAVVKVAGTVRTGDEIHARMPSGPVSPLPAL